MLVSLDICLFPRLNAGAGVELFEADCRVPNSYQKNHILRLMGIGVFTFFAWSSLFSSSSNHAWASLHIRWLCPDHCRPGKLLSRMSEYQPEFRIQRPVLFHGYASMTLRIHATWFYLTLHSLASLNLLSCHEWRGMLSYILEAYLIPLFDVCFCTSDFAVTDLNDFLSIVGK